MARERAVRRRQRRSRRASLAGAAVTALVLLGLSASSASQLTVTTTSIATFTDSRCTNATMSVHVDPTGQTSWWQYNKTAVRIVNFPTSCNGSSVAVTVTNGAGGAIASGTATCNSPTVHDRDRYRTTPRTAAGVSMLAATWGVPVKLGQRLHCQRVHSSGFYMDCT